MSLHHSNIEEYICPICRDILTQPVSLPCKHSCCYECLEKTLESNKFQCFFCRKFIGSWYRNAKKKKSLINDKLWKFIQEKFADLVDKKINGENIDIISSSSKFPTTLCTPGEIKQEFEVYAESIQKEYRMMKEKEEKLSEELIKKLQDEEEEYLRKQRELAMNDEEIAKHLAEELNSEVDEDTNRKHIQLLEDEKIAKTLEGLDQINRAVPRRVETLRPHVRNLKIKTPPRKVSVGPMDRYLGKRKRRD